jgi:group II intron reverse transcriptase/maturase
MEVHVIKTVPITYEMVVESYQKVRRGGKASGVDEQSWETFDKNAEDHLYMIWNRMTSGSYFPSAVREVEIPKKDGRMRKLGIPTLRDRIAQSVVKEYMEKKIDQHFHEHSYGYRPMKSSHQALEQVRKNCLTQDWVLDMDIEKYFDEINHELMLKAVEAMIEEKWVRMYVQRWLEMKIQTTKGELIERGGKGTPQGGVISPLLANLFLHYAIDKWLEKNYSETEFVRYADDIIIHCKTKQEAEEILQAIKERLQTVHLKLNEKKTQIVYCSDYKRKEKHNKVQFDFLGFSYQPRKSKSKFYENRSYTIYTPEISKGNQQKIRDTINTIVHWRNTTIEMEDIAYLLNSRLRGWINYFGKFGSSRLRSSLYCLEYRLIKWLMNKHKITSVRKSQELLFTIKTSKPKLFYHWTNKKYCIL